VPRITKFLTADLHGDSGNDRLIAGYGNATLFGGPGSDDLIGGPGNDLLMGQAGNDGMDGRKGHDRCKGGRGRDYRASVRRREIGSLAAGSLPQAVQVCDLLQRGCHQFFFLCSRLRYFFERSCFNAR
jgi:hypothetical protein